MKQRKIILTVTNDLTYDRRMHRICDALSASGAAVTLVGRELNSSVSFSPNHFKAVRLKCFITRGPLFYAEYNIRLLFHLLFTRFDIACAVDLDTVTAVRMASWIKNRNTVYDAHEYFTEVPELAHRPFVKKVWEFIGRMMIPGFHLRYTVSASLAKIMGEKYGSVFHVVRNIPATIKSVLSEQPPFTTRNKVLLYVGAINVGRGLEETIHAISGFQDWEFWMAGEGDITKELRELIVQLNAEDRIRLLGWVLPDQLPELMKQATLGINVLDQKGASYYYSLANKFFDFIHASLPSINIRFPEYEAICDQYPCCHLIDTADRLSISKAIQYLTENPAVMMKMKQACAEASRELSWEAESKKLIMLYESL